MRSIRERRIALAEVLTILLSIKESIVDDNPEAQEKIDEAAVEVMELLAEITEETEELLEVGPFRWVQLNPRKAMSVAIFLSSVISYVAGLFT
jgi:hypothetical protein